MRLNQRAAKLCDQLPSEADHLKISLIEHTSGATIYDFGVNSPGGIAAGLALANVCMSDLGNISIQTPSEQLGPWPTVAVRTDHPVAACMASQYAGWQLATDDYFGMGSGPMRAAAGREELFDKIGHREDTPSVVGVVEAAQIPTDSVIDKVAAACRVEQFHVTLCVAPTKSVTGTIQIVARSVETAMHKLFDLGFDLNCVESGIGFAPLPPPAKDDLAGIGRTNDSILYGADVTLWVRGDDAALAEIVPRIPSNSSSDHGQTFAEIFTRYDRDFYKIDPHLFSPAKISLINLNSGKTFSAGQPMPEIIEQSFKN